MELSVKTTYNSTTCSTSYLFSGKVQAFSFSVTLHLTPHTPPDTTWLLKAHSLTLRLIKRVMAVV